MRGFLVFAVLLCLCVGSLQVSAGEMVRKKSFAQVDCRKSKPNKEEQAAALQALKRAIITKYIDESSEPRRSLLNAKKDQIFLSPDNYLSQLVILDKTTDEKARTYRMVGEALVDPAKFDSLLDQGKKQTNADDLNVTWIFVARRQSSVKEIGPKVVTGTTKMKTETGTSGVNTQSDSTDVNSASKSQEAVIVEKAVTKSADVVTYDLEDNKKASIDSAMSKVFIDRGFNVVPVSELAGASGGGFNPDKLQEDFKNSSQFTLEHQQIATKVCKEAGMPFLAIGALTIGLKDTDPATGMVRVSVSIDAEVRDCRGKFSNKLASIGALQVSGLGPNQTEAENVALKNAAEQAASTLADQLRRKLNP